MINEKDLRRKLQEKQKELDMIQQELDAAKYEKILSAFSAGICSSDRVIPLLKAHNLNADDARYFGSVIGKHIDELYPSVADAIGRRQAERFKKNEARKERGRKSKSASSIAAPAATPPKQKNNQREQSGTAAAAEGVQGASEGLPRQVEVGLRPNRHSLDDAKR